MNVTGKTTLVIASAAPRYICTTSLIPTERKKEQQEIKETCAKVLPASYNRHPIFQPQRVASFAAGKNVISFSVLESSAHWLQYRKFSVITCAYMYRWDVGHLLLN